MTCALEQVVQEPWLICHLRRCDASCGKAGCQLESLQLTLTFGVQQLRNERVLIRQRPLSRLAKNVSESRSRQIPCTLLRLCERLFTVLLEQCSRWAENALQENVAEFWAEQVPSLKPASYVSP